MNEKQIKIKKKNKQEATKTINNNKETTKQETKNKQK